MTTAVLCFAVGCFVGIVVVLVFAALMSSSVDTRYEEHRREIDRRQAHEKALMEYLQILERQLAELWSKDDPK